MAVTHNCQGLQPVIWFSFQATRRPSKTSMGRASLQLPFTLIESQGENLFPHMLFLTVSLSLKKEKDFLSNSQTR